MPFRADTVDRAGTSLAARQNFGRNSSNAYAPIPAPTTRPILVIPSSKFEISVTCIIEMPGMHRPSHGGRADGRAADGMNRFILASTCFVPAVLSCRPASLPPSTGRGRGGRMTAALITISWEPFESVGRWIPDALSSPLLSSLSLLPFMSH